MSKKRTRLLNPRQMDDFQIQTYLNIAALNGGGGCGQKDLATIMRHVLWVGDLAADQAAKIERLQGSIKELLDAAVASGYCEYCGRE